MLLKLREFELLGGSVSWQNSTLLVAAPSMPILSWFDNDVLARIDEQHIQLTSENWAKLMPHLYQQLLHSIPASDVHIELNSSSLVLCAVGLKKVVRDVIATFSTELNKGNVIEQ